MLGKRKKLSKTKCAAGGGVLLQHSLDMFYTPTDATHRASYNHVPTTPAEITLVVVIIIIIIISRAA